MSVFSRVIVLLIFYVTAGHANASGAGGHAGEAGREIVVHAIAIANQNFTKAKLSDGSHPAPLTQRESRSGVIPFEAARRIVDVAVYTARAEFCGLDWVRLSFLPLMKRERGRGIWSDRQIAYIGTLHGVVQGTYLRSLRQTERCSDDERRNMEDYLSPK